jgi:galactonate dehydratase
MKIEEVESHIFGNLHFVRIHTDRGVDGLGQSACWAYPEAVAAVVDTFRPYLLGQNPLQTERHWHHLYRMGPFRGSILGAALSAIDIALWDIKGRHLGVPVWELLGGRYRDRLRLHLLLTDGSDHVGSALWAVDEGFTAVKFNPLPSNYYNLPLSQVIKSTHDLVAEVRSAVGSEIDIILELQRSLTPLYAYPLIDALRPFRPLFIEDPIQIDSITSQAEIGKAAGLPAANGERLNTIWEFRELLAQGGSQYLRADVGLAGGISHGKKIAALAESYHSAVVWHSWLGPVITAASASIGASTPNFLTQEYHIPTEEGEYSNGFRSAFKRQGGELVIPDTPGLGVEMDAEHIGDMNLLGRPLHAVPIREDGSVAFAV